MGKYGVEYDEFTELIAKVERLGVSADEIADKVLEKVAPTAVEIFRKHLPYDDEGRDDFHAKEHVKASKITKTGKNGRYKLIGVFDEKGAKLDWTIAQYLFYLENGTSKIPAQPFVEKAEREIGKIVQPMMKEELENEIKRRLEGG